MLRGLFMVVVAGLAVAGTVAAAPVYRDIADTYGEHTRAVELGRAGHYDQALAILGALLTQFPDDYPLQRDYALIAVWKGDCGAALERFERIRDNPKLESYLIAPLQDCGVRLAREGQYDAGLRVLEPFLRLYPDHYPLQRDAILIAIWKNDCKAALVRYERVRGRPDPEPYFAVPVADCLLESNRPKEAMTLLRTSATHHPQDESLAHALAKAEVALRLGDDLDDERHELLFDLASDESEQGLREWWSRLEASTRVAERTRLYTRYFVTRSTDEQFDVGEQDRAGLGVRYRFNEQWRIDQEFSLDVREAHRDGSTTWLTFEPRDNLRFDLAYHSFAEDLPLRARAAGIEGDKSEGAVETYSYDYVWYARAAAMRYDFSDHNRRAGEYATLGYAWEMLPRREQRVFVEWYQSRNTRDDAPYFNPRHDRSPGLVHRTDFVYDSRFKRHVDRLEFSLGSYSQDGFATRDRWGVSYEQEYELDEDQRLEWAVGFRRNAYDGAPEDEWQARLRYARRF
jgi:hypothetical protein